LNLSCAKKNEFSESFKGKISKNFTEIFWVKFISPQHKNKTQKIEQEDKKTKGFLVFL
jgi:hypothetical protein